MFLLGMVPICFCVAYLIDSIIARGDQAEREKGNEDRQKEGERRDALSLCRILIAKTVAIIIKPFRYHRKGRKTSIKLFSIFFSSILSLETSINLHKQLLRDKTCSISTDKSPKGV